MPKLEFFLVSESISTDQHTNYLSLFSIAEDITVALPALLPRLIATTSWNLGPEDMDRDFQAVLRVHRPNGELMEGLEDVAINFTGERSRHRVHHELRGLPIHEAGDWKFEIFLNGEHAASHIVTVHAQEDQI